MSMSGRASGGRQTSAARPSGRAAEAPTEIEVVSTHHGPIILGGPPGYGIASKQTSTAGPNAWAECLPPMLRSRSVDDMDEAMRGWVDPCNNFVFADVDGDVEYLNRGRLPVRPALNGWLPVPGWSGEYEWDGFVPFEELVRSKNPDTGYIVTANNRIAPDDYPHYIALHYAPEYRARRIKDRVEKLDAATVEDMAGIHAEIIIHTRPDLRQASTGRGAPRRGLGPIPRRIGRVGRLDGPGIRRPDHLQRVPAGARVGPAGAPPRAPGRRRPLRDRPGRADAHLPDAGQVRVRRRQRRCERAPRRRDLALRCCPDPVQGRDVAQGNTGRGHRIVAVGERPLDTSHAFPVERIPEARLAAGPSARPHER